MRVLVTGASGFIGRNVVAQLAADGRYEVFAASRNAQAQYPAGVTGCCVDLLAPGAPAAIIAAVAPTHLIHLAWDATPGRFWTSPDNADWAAATTALVAAFCRGGGQRAVLAGTCAEYAWDHTVLRESDVTAPATFYGIAKDATRRIVCATGTAAGVGIAWGRIFWLYGPGEMPGRLVSDVAAALAAGTPAACGPGTEARDFLHVADVAGAFIAALDSGWTGPFNIGSGIAVPVRRVVELLGDAAARSDLLRVGARPAAPSTPPALSADTAVLTNEIGFVPRYTLEHGLTETYRWWRDRAG